MQHRPVFARRILAPFLLVLVFAAAPAAVAQGTNLLSSAWRFRTGDEPAYATPACDDRSWRILRAGTRWEDQAVAGYDGYAWYRQTLTIPSSLRTRAETYGGFILQLGQVDDVDETYFNGVRIGGMGQLPPDYDSAYDQQRRYRLPAGLVRWDQPNVVAVRVYDGGGDGGLLSSPSLAVCGPLANVVATPAFARSDRVLLGADRQAAIHFANEFSLPMNLRVSVTVTTDAGAVSGSTAESFMLAAAGRHEVPLPVASLAPGFYRAVVTVEEATEQSGFTVPFAVRPEELASATDAPADFRAFWDRTLTELAQVPPQYSATRHSEQPFADKTVYLVEMRSLGQVRVRGWLGVPNRPGRHPAILQVQGYSWPQSATDVGQPADFVVFALNIRGHGNSQDDVNPGFPQYLTQGLDSRETYIYRGAFMDCVRAMDFLASRPEVDPTRIAVEGGSQGGALALATAALDPRVAVCVPSIPGFSDYRTWFQMAEIGQLFLGWPQTHPPATEAGMFQTLSYFDVKNFAPSVRVPTLLSVGLRDVNCPARIGFAAFNHLGGEKQFLIYPESAHGLPGTYWLYKYDWIRRKFGLLPTPSLAAQPASEVVRPGGTAAFVVDVAGEVAAAVSYQWQRRRAGEVLWSDLTDDTVFGGTARQTLTVATAGATGNRDEFRCVVTAAGETIVSQAAGLVVIDDPAGAGTRLVNLSVRARAGTGDGTLILGFVVAGAGTKQLLVRGIGPGLATLGVDGVLGDPDLRLLRLDGTLVGRNDDWGGTGWLSRTFAELGAFPLGQNSGDAAVLTDFAPGACTAHLGTGSAAAGVGMVEIYDADYSPDTRLVNASVRAPAGSGSNTLVAGFVIRGSGAMRVLVRGVGPGLRAQGVAGALANPVLRLHNRAGTVLHDNDDWVDTPALAEATRQAGAAALAPGSADAAFVAELREGVYTAHATSSDGGSGIALIEVYEVR